MVAEACRQVSWRHQRRSLQDRAQPPAVKRPGLPTCTLSPPGAEPSAWRTGQAGRVHSKPGRRLTDAATTASRVLCGMPAWPPCPVMVTWKRSEAAKVGPACRAQGQGSAWRGTEGLGAWGGGEAGRAAWHPEPKACRAVTHRCRAGSRPCWPAPGRVPPPRVPRRGSPGGQAGVPLRCPAAGPGRPPCPHAPAAMQAHMRIPACPHAQAPAPHPGPHHARGRRRVDMHAKHGGDAIQRAPCNHRGGAALALLLQRSGAARLQSGWCLAVIAPSCRKPRLDEVAQKVAQKPGSCKTGRVVHPAACPARGPAAPPESPPELTAGWKSRRTVPCSCGSMPLSALAAARRGATGAAAQLRAGPQGCWMPPQLSWGCSRAP